MCSAMIPSRLRGVETGVHLSSAFKNMSLPSLKNTTGDGFLMSRQIHTVISGVQTFRSDVAILHGHHTSYKEILS